MTIQPRSQQRMVRRASALISRHSQRRNRPIDRGSEGDKAVIPAGVHVVNIPDGQVVKLRVAGRPFEIELPGEAEVTLLNNWGVEIGKPVVASAGVFSEENPSRVHAVQLNPVPEEDMEVRLTVKDE